MTATVLVEVRFEVRFPAKDSLQESDAIELGSSDGQCSRYRRYWLCPGCAEELAVVCVGQAKGVPDEHVVPPNLMGPIRDVLDMHEVAMSAMSYQPCRSKSPKKPNR